MVARAHSLVLPAPVAHAQFIALFPTIPPGRRSLIDTVAARFLIDGFLVTANMVGQPALREQTAANRTRSGDEVRTDVNSAAKHKPNILHRVCTWAGAETLHRRENTVTRRGNYYQMLVIAGNADESSS